MDEAGDRRGGKVAAELERLAREGENIGGRNIPDVAMDADAPTKDVIEIWGRRIGRTLGWAAVAFLLFQLMRIYGQ